MKPISFVSEYIVDIVEKKSQWDLKFFDRNHVYIKKYIHLKYDSEYLRLLKIFIIMEMSELRQLRLKTFFIFAHFSRRTIALLHKLSLVSSRKYVARYSLRVSTFSLSYVGTRVNKSVTVIYEFQSHKSDIFIF